MTTPQIIMTVLLTLRFVGPLARAFGAEFPVRKREPPWVELTGAAIAVGVYVFVLDQGGFW
jgi:hypothetical protein